MCWKLSYDPTKMQFFYEEGDYKAPIDRESAGLLLQERHEENVEKERSALIAYRKQLLTASDHVLEVNKAQLAVLERIAIALNTIACKS